jgi:hypothetical protein
VYSACEIPARNALYAAQTSCRAERPEDCRGDSILEYDSRTLSLVAKHSFFGDDFYGRMLYLLCLDDRVQVGMSGTRNGRRVTMQNVMEFRADRPADLVKDLLQAPFGVVMLHDRANRQVFYTSEFSNQVLRVDHRSDPPRRSLGTLRTARSFRPPYNLGPFVLGPPGSLSTMIDATYPERGSGFFAEWIRGTKVIELDLGNRAEIGAYWTRNGGTSSLAVDPGLHRLFATGMWGVEVFDLRTRELILRRRTEFAPRLPIVDAKHDRVYVTATFGNHIEIWDRKTLARLGRLAVGVGARNAHLTADGRHYLSSAFGEFYAWRTEELARR